MRPRILLALILASSLVLSGCEPLATRPTHTTVITWARMGTPARIVDDRSIRVLIPDGAGGWTPGEASLAGMVAIDEPTLTYYQGLDHPLPSAP
ncbi:MAG: hypothetical protein H0V44_00235 [Planctomycetes bacterium]|nr:hypothetical protein [Planctomycetota bacterium]